MVIVLIMCAVVKNKVAACKKEGKWLCWQVNDVIFFLLEMPLKFSHHVCDIMSNDKFPVIALNIICGSPV